MVYVFHEIKIVWLTCGAAVAKCSTYASNRNFSNISVRYMLLLFGFVGWLDVCVSANWINLLASLTTNTKTIKNRYRNSFAKLNYIYLNSMVSLNRAQQLNNWFCIRCAANTSGSLFPLRSTVLTRVALALLRPSPADTHNGFIRTLFWKKLEKTLEYNLWIFLLIFF